MKCCLVRKVPVKVPGTKNRLIFALVLAEGEGLALLFTKKLSQDGAHSLIVATEGKDRIFQAVDRPQFPLENTEDLSELGWKLHAIAEALSKEETDSLLRSEDLP